MDCDQTSLKHSDVFDIGRLEDPRNDRRTTARIQQSIESYLSTISGSLCVSSRPQSSKNEPELRSRHFNSRTGAKIAIVGIAGRFPRASTLDGFWDILINGVDTHEMVPPSRWDHRTHVSPEPHAEKNVSGTGFGCWLHDAGDFDARFFNMSPREASQVDPAQRLALLCATEALEQAGIVPGRTPSSQKNRVGVYFGATSNDWMETNSAQNIDSTYVLRRDCTTKANTCPAYFIPGGNRAFIPGRINYHFKFSGPSYTIDTACSSSLTAIHLACNALWRGEVDTAIVGGINVLTNPDMTAGLDKGHFLSRTGNCKTFDEAADGYCRGEAVVAAVLKRLDDAMQDCDPVHACILSIATNHSAEADSITRPHVGAQQSLIDNVLREAGIDATSISYVEMHGTGTQAGDAAESAFVLESLAPKGRRTSQQPLHIGAAKANIGHGEAAAGASSLAKVLLMLKHSTIPPHCGIKGKINPKIPELATRNVHIAGSPADWPRPVGGVRRVLINNFSAAGGNTALILEDAPLMRCDDVEDPRSYHVVSVSAKTAFSLNLNLKALIAWIEKGEDQQLALPRLSYTTTTRRTHHPHRVVATRSSLREIKASPQESLRLEDGVNRPKGTPKFVFTFTGQGSHYQGMGMEYYKGFSAFRDDIRSYDQLCIRFGLPSIRGLFETDDAWDEATPSTLQLATVSLQMALCRLWLSRRGSLVPSRRHLLGWPESRTPPDHV